MKSHRDECAACRLGSASGHGQGMFCPFIDREYPVGAVLCREGDPAGYIWYVREGAVTLSRRGRAAFERRVAGTFVGIEALTCDTYLDTAVAATDVVLCGATSDGFRAWLAADPTHREAMLDITKRTRSAQSVQPARGTTQEEGQVDRDRTAPAKKAKRKST